MLCVGPLAKPNCSYLRHFRDSMAVAVDIHFKVHLTYSRPRGTNMSESIVKLQDTRPLVKGVACSYRLWPPLDLCLTFACAPSSTLHLMSSCLPTAFRSSQDRLSSRYLFRLQLRRRIITSHLHRLRGAESDLCRQRAPGRDLG